MRIIHFHFNVIVCDNLRLRLIMSAKKPRKANFSEAEVNVLVEAVAESYSTLYGKFSPRLTHSMKTSAWEDVAEKYELIGFLKKKSIM